MISVRIYLDACCLSRLTDDQIQPRIRHEAAAVEKILKRVHEGAILWVSSDVLLDEIVRIPRPEKRLETIALLAFASEAVEVNTEIRARARELQSAGYGPFDALHLACAEAARVDAILTTDDGFIGKASRGVGRPRVAVLNPLFWSRESFHE